MHIESENMFHFLVEKNLIVGCIVNQINDLMILTLEGLSFEDETFNIFENCSISRLKVFKTSNRN